MSTLTLELPEDVLAELKESARRFGRTVADEARVRLEQEAQRRARVKAELEELRQFRESAQLGQLTDEILAEAKAERP